MAYQNLTLRNIAGEITAQFNDGSFRSLTPPDPSSGEVAAFIGTASSGVTHEFFRHVDLGRTFTEFGADSEIARMVQSAKASDEALPIIVSRIGAKNASVGITRKITNSHEKEMLLRITPKFVQEADQARGRVKTLDAIKVILLPYVEGSFVRQRVILGLESPSGTTIPVYDSERLFVADGETIFDVEMNLPVGEIFYTDAGLASDIKIAAELNLADEDGGNKGWKDKASAAERIEMLRKLNDVNSCDWEKAKKLSDASWDDNIYLLHIYEAPTQDDLNTDAGVFDRELSDGKVNKSISNKSERYVGVDLAYQNLQFEDVGYIYCEGCHADVESVELDDLEDSGASLEAKLQWPNQKLGNLWKVEHNGSEYSYMFGHREPFTASNVTAATITVKDSEGDDKEIVCTPNSEHKKLGDLLNLVDIVLHPDGADNEDGLEVESFANDKGRIECHVTFAGANINGATLHTPFTNLNIPNMGAAAGTTYKFRLRPTVVGASFSTGLRDTLITSEKASAAKTEPNFTIDDPFVMTHFDLTGETVPEAVLANLIDFPELFDSKEKILPSLGAATFTSGEAKLVASNEQVREISFLQQAAQAAYTASTNYSQCIAIVPTSAPRNSDRGLQSWAGQPASYEVNSAGELKVTDDGSGILGMKLLAGHSGYRDGQAFGGIMLTEGESLPNKKPYGIDDEDEARDAYGEVIDLGKHVVVVGAYGITPDPEATLNRRRANQTGGVYTNAGPKICGILNSLAPGHEPIGQVNGRVSGMVPRHRTNMSTLNNLALIRVCMIDQNGIISSIYTAAQPNSDYRKVSSIMSSNAILKQLRNIAMPYVGRPFKDEEIASLTQTIDGSMKQMVSQGYAQSINVSLSASRLDRINGVLRASVRFVPPLSIEAITVEITLEPPAAGL
jgi:hypothetical protein